MWRVSSTHVSSAEFARLSTCGESDGYYLEIAVRARSAFFLFLFFCLFVFIFGVIRFTRCGDGASWGHHPHTVPLCDVARCVLFNVRMLQRAVRRQTADRGGSGLGAHVPTLETATQAPEQAPITRSFELPSSVWCPTLQLTLSWELPLPQLESGVPLVLCGEGQRSQHGHRVAGLVSARLRARLLQVHGQPSRCGISFTVHIEQPWIEQVPGNARVLQKILTGGSMTFFPDAQK